MPGSDKTVRVRLVAETTPYTKGMTQASAATKSLGRDMDGIGAKAKGVERDLGKASGAVKGLAVAGGALAGAAVVGFLSDSVKAAGDLQQSLGGVDAVFKDTAEIVHKFGETSAESVGLSTNAFNELITATGAMLKNKGIEDFTQKSIDLVKVGADLAATFGGSTADAVNALNAAMRGESDPIERYGISLNEAAVNAKIAEQGLSNLTGAALDQAKAQARLQIVTQQSADATGAFAREADTLQGQQQRLNAQWEDAKAQLGSALLPALTDVVSMLREGVDIAVAAANAFNDIPTPVKAAAAALIALHIAGKPVGAAFGSIRDSARRLREEMVLQQALATGISGGYQKLGDEATATSEKISRTSTVMAVAGKGAKGLGSALLGAFGGPVGLAITGVAVALGVYLDSQAKAKASTEQFTEALKASNGAIDENIRAITAKNLNDEGMLKLAREAGLNLDDFTNAALGNADAIKRINAQLDLQQTLLVTAPGDVSKLKEAIGGQNDALNEGVQAWKDQRAAIGPVNDAAHDAAGGMGELATATDKAVMSEETRQGILKDTADAQKKANDEVRKAAQAILDLHDAQLAASDSNIAYQQSIDDAADRLGKFAELQKQLDKAGGTSDRTKKLESKLADTTDVKKRAAIQKDLADSRARDAKKQTEEQAKLREEMAKFAHTLDLTTEAGRGNQKALNDIASSARAAAQQNLEAGTSQATVNKQMDDARAKFITTAQGFGATKQAAEQMAAQFGLTRDEVAKTSEAITGVPTVKNVAITARTAEARAAVTDLRDQIAGVQSKTVTISARINLAGIAETRRTVDDLRDQLGLGGKGFAKGTPSAPPGMAWVGEQGPELVQFKGGERVFTASQSAALARSLVRMTPQAASGPSSHSETWDQRIDSVTVVAPRDFDDFQRQIERRRRRSNSSRSGW